LALINDVVLVAELADEDGTMIMDSIVLSRAVEAVESVEAWAVLLNTDVASRGTDSLLLTGLTGRAFV
jgi:hypothetical protein